MPHQKDTSLGVELAPEKEPDRVASVELNMSGSLLLTLPLGSRSTAPPPPMSPPGEVHSYKTVMVPKPTLADKLNLTDSAFPSHVVALSATEIVPESAEMADLA